MREPPQCPATSGHEHASRAGTSQSPEAAGCNPQAAGSGSGGSEAGSEDSMESGVTAPEAAGSDHEVRLWRWTYSPVAMAAVVWITFFTAMVLRLPDAAGIAEGRVKTVQVAIMWSLRGLPFIASNVWYHIAGTGMSERVIAPSSLLILCVVAASVFFLQSPISDVLGFILGYGVLLPLWGGRRPAWGFAYSTFFLFFGCGSFLFVRQMHGLVEAMPDYLVFLPQNLHQLELIVSRRVWYELWRRFGQGVPAEVFTMGFCVNTGSSDIGYMVSFMSCAHRESGQLRLHRAAVLVTSNVVLNVVTRMQLHHVALSAARGRNYDISWRRDVHLTTRWGSPYHLLPFISLSLLCGRIGQASSVAAQPPFPNQGHVCMLLAWVGTELVSDALVLLLQHGLRRSRQGPVRLAETWSLLQKTGGHLVPRPFSTGAPSKIATCPHLEADRLTAWLWFRPEDMICMFHCALVMFYLESSITGLLKHPDLSFKFRGR